MRKPLLKSVPPDRWQDGVRFLSGLPCVYNALTEVDRQQLLRRSRGRQMSIGEAALVLRELGWWRRATKRGGA